MFSVDQFFDDPQGKLSTIVYAKKTELLSLAVKYEIAVNSRDRKDEIKNTILEYLIDENFVTELEARKFMSETKKSDVEYMKLALQLEEKKLEADIERKKFELETEKAKIQFELETEKDKRQFELRLALEKEREELELTKAKLDHEAYLARNLEHEKFKLSVDEKRHILDLESKVPVKFDLSKALKLVPDFNENDVDSFFRNFEDIASSMHWPLDQWNWLVKAKFTGRASLVISHLVGEKNYEVIKQAVLDAYLVTAEGHRQKFRQYFRSQNQTWYEFANEKLRLFTKWIKAANVDNFDSLVNLIVTEEFMRKLPQNIKISIADKGEDNLKKAAMLADNYHLIHKTFKDPEKSVKQGKATFGNGEKEYAVTCSYCKKSGHSIADCKNPSCKKSKLSSDKSVPQYPDKFKDSKINFKGQGSLHCYTLADETLYDNYICDGLVTLPNSGIPINVKILRDTGSTQSMILHRIIPNVNLLDENVLVKDLSSTKLLPLTNLTLDCKYVKGNVKMAVLDSDLPINNVHVLLGNDLADKNPLPNLILYDKPPTSGLLDDLSHEGNLLEEVKTDSSNVMAVTRAKAKANDLENVESLQNFQIPCKPVDLLKLQKEDSTLTNAFKEATVNDKGSKVPGYYLDNGILFRFYRPRKLSSKDAWAEKNQLVVPLSLRQQILITAHQAESHLGITKTYNRITNEFFWPNLKRDVVEFVKQCHTCQIVGKPNEVIPKAPLIPIVVPHEPFSKIIIDCVGPLPKTSKGNQYILTAMCPTTRYPIAIPLRNISAKTIVKHLVSIFTIYGFPKEIQSDRGTNFTSDLFNQTLKELNVKHTLASPYHPESQGALERNHQTLKSLIKKFCVETGKDWDDSIDLLLFTIREVPNESLGISPFEMLFGHKVRGPMQILKDKLLDNTNLELVNIGHYVSKLKDNILNIYEFAHKNLTNKQEIMKCNFDKTSKARKFKIGEYVLVYFPTSTSPLKHKFSGPYVITKCVNNNNYIVDTPDRRKSSQLVHVNLIKRYHGKMPVALHCLSDSNITKCTKTTQQERTSNLTDTDLHESCDDISWADCTNNEILTNLPVYFQHLTHEQSSSLQEMLQEHKGVCGDVPQLCDLAKHDIELLPNTRPIKQQFYRVSAEKQKVMKQEVSYLIENGLATLSSSPWASPCILVPKPNGKVRLCTDYRKVNNVTVKDSYPLPRIDDILDAIGNARYLTQIDMLRGYYQIELTERAKLISAFITPFGLFQYERLPFGLSNAPATFQRIVNHAIQDLPGTFAYIDDIVVVSDTWDEHVLRLQSLLTRLKEVGLTINLAKSSFGKAKVRYLGHVIGCGEVFPKKENITAILEYPIPSNRKSLLRFLGMASYYRKFCKNYSIVASPLIDATSPKSKFTWTDECNHSFNQLKNLLCSNPVLSAPDLSKNFIMQVDACNTGVGAVLLQENLKSGLLHPISFYSYKLKKHQLSYSTVEKELLAIVLTLQKYEVYFSSNMPITIYTDHNPLVFLARGRLTNQRLLRWSLFLQNFNLTIHYIKGSENIMADALSRMNPSTERPNNSHDNP